MPRFIGLFIGFLIFFIGCSTVPPVVGMTVGQRVDRANANTVALIHKRVVDGEVRVKPYCTGVWVMNDVILTAHHCIEGLLKITIEEKLSGMDSSKIGLIDIKELTIEYIFAEEVTGINEIPAGVHNATVLSLSKENDLALLKAVNPSSLPRHGVAELAEKSPMVGSRIHIVGHVTGLYWTYVEGIVSGYRKDLKKMGMSRGGPFLQISAPVYYGNSGGGAFNSEGELIGIASFISAAPNVGFFIHLENIRGMMAREGLIKLKIDERVMDPEL